MAEEVKSTAPAEGGSASGGKTAAPEGEAAGKKPRKKSLRPTNCAQSNKRIRRKDWYYRNGRYFANKQAFKLFVKQEEDKKAKAAADAAAKAAEAKKAAETAAAAAAEAPKTE